MGGHLEITERPDEANDTYTGREPFKLMQQEPGSNRLKSFHTGVWLSFIQRAGIAHM